MSLLGDIIKKELEALIAKYLPDFKNAVYAETRRALDAYYSEHSSPGVPPMPEPEVHPTPSTNMVLFDLKKVPAEMNAAGIPGREGIVLYALCQAANGYPIPGQSEELIQITTYYDEVQEFYDIRIAEGLNFLIDNPNATITLITNDALDRFGFRLLPPTAEAFRKFDTRVNSGVIVPEEAYGK